MVRWFVRSHCENVWPTRVPTYSIEVYSFILGFTMIQIRLDAIASSFNFVAAVMLAIDALTARRRTLIKRGGAKLIEGLQKTGENDLALDSSGRPLNNTDALEDASDRRTTKTARTAFVLLLIGFGLDLFTKVCSNPSLLSK